MRFTQSAACLTAIAIAGLAPVATAAAAIYVTDTNGNTVSVINGRASAVTATIPVGNSPEGVAVDPKTHTVYVTHNGSTVSPGHTVSVINGRTNAVTATLRVGRVPGGVAADPKTGTSYVTNLGDGTVSVLAPCPR